MFGITKIGYRQDYKINPVYQKYYDEYLNAAKNYEYLEKKVKNGNATPTEVKKLTKIEQEMHIAENHCQNTPQVIKNDNNGITTLKNQPSNQHKLDYYC